MGVVQRGVVFAIGTVSNAVIFLFMSRALLPLIDRGTAVVGTGPGTAALDLLPIAMQLGMGLLQIGLIVYFIGGLSQEQSGSRRPMP